LINQPQQGIINIDKALVFLLKINQAKVAFPDIALIAAFDHDRIIEQTAVGFQHLLPQTTKNFLVPIGAKEAFQFLSEFVQILHLFFVLLNGLAFKCCVAVSDAATLPAIKRLHPAWQRYAAHLY
jgi:hypothetical protein